MGMGGWKLHIFPFAVREREPACQWCYISFSGNFGGLDCHSPPAKKHCVLDLRISATHKTINSKAAMNWQNMSTRMGMGAGGNGNNQWEWERNGNKTRLNLGSGMRMEMNHWEWQGMWLEKTFPVISILHSPPWAVCSNTNSTRVMLSHRSTMPLSLSPQGYKKVLLLAHSPLLQLRCSAFINITEALLAKSSHSQRLTHARRPQLMRLVTAHYWPPVDANQRFSFTCLFL